jgi:hypothetical protein
MSWFLCILLTAAGQTATKPTAVLDGPSRSGALVAVQPGQIVLDDNRQQPIALGDLVEWGAPPETPLRPLVVLADGGRLAADTLQVDGETAAVESESFGELKMPRTSLAGLVLRAPAERRALERLLDRMAAHAGPRDRLLLANGDELEGRLERMNESSVAFRGDGGPAQVERARLAAVIFAERRVPAGVQATPRLWLGTRDGSRLLADRLEPDAAGVRAVLAAGPAVRVRLADVVWLQPSGGRAVYLSDLPATGYRHVPYLTLAWPYRNDRSVTGTPLRAGGREYAKGLGMHSTARLTYLLAEPYRSFQAELAIDQQTAGGGSVRFRVFVDGREKFASPTLRGGDKPLPVSVDLSAAKRLDLVVDFADRADQLDHADWLNARLLR